MDIRLRSLLAVGLLVLVSSLVAFWPPLASFAARPLFISDMPPAAPGGTPLQATLQATGTFTVHLPILRRNYPPPLYLRRTVASNNVCAGSYVRHNFSVTNLTDTYLYNISISDSVLGQVESGLLLSPGETKSYAVAAALSLTTTFVSTATGMTFQGGYTSTAANTVSVYQASGPNLCAANLEVTQAIQSPGNSTMHIANREAFARLYLLSSGTITPFTSVNASLTGYRNGGELGTLAAVNGPITAPLTLDRGDLDHTLNFDLPLSWMSDDVQLVAQLSFAGDSYAADDRYPASGRTSIEVHPAEPLRIRIVPVVWQGYGPPDTSDLSYLTDFLLATYPTDEIETSVHPVYSTAADLGTGGGWSQLLGEIHSLRTSDDPAYSGWHYYGLVDNSGGLIYAGIGYIGIDTAVGWDSAYGAGSTAAHEIGHNAGRYHAPCGNPSNIDPNYPYPQASINDYGYNPLDGTLRSPGTYKDYMSYCGPEWVSDYTYEGIYYGDFEQSSLTLGLAEASGPAEAAVLIRGTITGAGVELYPVQLATAPVMTGEGRGDYQVVFRDAAGAELLKHRFAPVEMALLGALPGHEERWQGFHLALPRVENLARVEVWRRGQLVAELGTSGKVSPPAALTAAPYTSDDGGSGVTLHWGGSRPGLTYRVAFAAGDGSAPTWQTIASNLSETTFTADTSLLPGTPAGWFRVTASDGLAEASQIIGPVAVADKAPSASLILPSSKRTYAPHQPINLLAMGSDPEDGPLPDEAFRWTIAGFGEVVTGRHLEYGPGLPPGDHPIQLQVIDSYGNVTRREGVIHVR